MKKIQAMACMTAIALTGTLGFSACSSDTVEEASANVVFDENGTAGVKPEFVISIPRTVVGSTRMSNAVTQNQGTVSQFRGLDNIRLIAFAGEPTSSSTKLSDIIRLSAISSLSSPGAINYKVYADQFVPVGTKNFLFYAKAVDNEAEAAISSMNDKFKYGTLTATGLNNDEFTTPNGITFSLEPINTSADRQAGDATGQNIVALMNSLANTTVSGVATPHNAWKTTTQPVLAGLYRQFIGISVASSNSLATNLSKLFNSLKHVTSDDPAYPLAQALRTKVLDACTSTPASGAPALLTSSYRGYPQNIGLPEGAVSVRWNASGAQANSFVDITANYGQGFNKVKITDYVYPAALWYYVSTPLKASTQIESADYASAGNWDGVINSVYADAADEVQDNTKSVALQKAAEYAVGRIETRIKMNDGTYYDGAGETIAIGDGFTLKGMLIGGQCSAAYDFTALGNENQTIYDRNMASTTIIAKANSTTATANQTLALQTKKDQPVKVALELVNNAQDFMGADGLIAKGATFYLTATLDPKTAANYVDGTLDKIVMKDYVTKVTVTIKNGSTEADRNNDGTPDVYVKDEDGNPIGVDEDGDGQPDPYDIDGDGNPDPFITDPDHGGPGWDTDGDGEVDIPVLPDDEGNYPDAPTVPEGLGNATNGTPDLTSPGIELGTSVNLEWQEGLILNPEI